jgi:sugar-phosphatase
MVRYWFERRPWNTLSLEEVEDQIVAELCGLIASNLQPLPGARALIDLLTAAGMPLAIASSSPAKIIRAVLDGLGMTERFAVVHSAEDEARGKPAPDIYLSAARQLGAPPSRCLAFEDSPAGIRSAFEAGLFVVAVPSPGNWNAEGVDLAHRKLRSLLDFSLGGSSLDVRQEIGIVPPKVQ